MAAAISEANTLTRQLWHIAGSGDLEQLDELLSQGADVNAGDRTGVTALMRAAYHGQLAMVRALIFYGADPSKKDRSGLTALMMAEYGGHEEIVEALESFSAEGKTAFTKKRRVTASIIEENVDGVPDYENLESGNVAPTTRKLSVTEENVDVAPDYEDLESGKDAQTARTLSVTEENVDVASDYDDWESGKDAQTTRTLHEPLEIWEMVQTTATKPYLPSAGRGKVFSVRILALAVGALIVCSGAVFGFLALRGAMRGSNDASEQRSEATAPKQTSSSNERPSASTPLTKAPGKLTRSANEPTQLKPVEKLLREGVDTPALTTSVSSARKSSAIERPKATKVSAHFPKPNKTVRRATKLESEKEATSKPPKKEPAQAAVDPVKPSNRPKPKVIQWP